eukprot:TRINITY_DN4174_c0_g1_i1.p2 TRINITY_DN4174_c0_g1~~TRINITY_DN4174_c0_g1_i1.p2  ORF type:complete len:121 (+),score=22.73 TRINITY_DN4174_c0_g1_i1:459-821(+)
MEACRKIAGIAMLPTAENPVKNFAASSQSFPYEFTVKKSDDDPPPKNMQGIGTMMYMRAVSIGHQLFHSAQPRTCSPSPKLKRNANPARLQGTESSEQNFRSTECAEANTLSTFNDGEEY